MELQPASVANLASSALSNNRLADASEQIATGSRINSAADDPSGIQISIGITRDINENTVGLRNLLDGTSLTESAISGISQISESILQLRELSLQAQNGTLNDSDRQALKDQADQLLAQIRDSIDQTRFNGHSLLNEEGSIGIQAGESRTEIDTPDLLSSLGDQGLFSLDISSPEALESLDGSLDLLNQSAGSFAASQSQLDSNVRSLSDASVSEEAARSRISDADLAKAISEQSRELLQRDVNITLQAQANAGRSDILALLG